MHLHLAAGTPISQLDGTTSGIVWMIVVMLPALGLFLGLIFWAAREPRASKEQLQVAGGQSGPGAAVPIVTVEREAGFAEQVSG
jgi:hypothetical protein